MNKDINAFYTDLWNLEEKEEEEKRVFKFQIEEKDKNLFNERYKEDLEIIENIENPFISNNEVIIRINGKSKISSIKKAIRDIKREEKGI